MSGARFTFDSNILVYCTTHGDWRQPLVLDLLRRAAGGDCILTLQSLGEFFWVAGRKKLASRANVAAQVRQWLAIFPSSARASVAAMELAL